MLSFLATSRNRVWRSGDAGFRLGGVYSSCISSSITLPFHENTTHFRFPVESSQQVLGRRAIFSWILGSLDNVGQQSQIQEHFDPFSLVADDLRSVGNRLRLMATSEDPKVSSAAEYFFRDGFEGKRFRPTILLLMARALKAPLKSQDDPVDCSSEELRDRQQRLAEIAVMMHVASLLHDDVLDDADTRRGIGSVNFVMGNKLAVLAGDFLLARSCVALASLENTQVVALMSKVLENLVTGETMQMSPTAEQRSSMEYYMQKTYNKTASMVSNSCKSMALLAGQTPQVAMLAYEYGKNLGLAYQIIDDVLDFTGTAASLGKGSLSDIHHGIITAPLLFAAEEFPELQSIVLRGFESPADVDLVTFSASLTSLPQFISLMNRRNMQALEYLGKSKGIQKTMELARRHAHLASAAIDSLPENDDEYVLQSRRALVEITKRVITRTK